MTRSSFKMIWKEPSSLLEGKQIMPRGSLILPSHVGNIYYIHNGKSYVKLEIKKLMVYYKFADFISTRKRCIYRSKKGKKKKK